MSRKENETNESSVTSEEKTKRFPLASFRKNCIKAFQISTSTFDGATYGLADKEYSMDEMKSIIEKWKGKEVK